MLNFSSRLMSVETAFVPGTDEWLSWDPLLLSHLMPTHSEMTMTMKREIRQFSDGLHRNRHQGPHKPVSILIHAKISHNAKQQTPNLNVAFVTRLYEFPAGSCSSYDASQHFKSFPFWGVLLKCCNKLAIFPHTNKALTLTISRLITIIHTTITYEAICCYCYCKTERFV